MTQRFTFYIGRDGDEYELFAVELPVHKVVTTDFQFAFKQKENMVVLFVFEAENMVFFYFMIFESCGLGKRKYP
jgi:hypothetical protein